MKITISLDDVYTDEDWSRTVAEIVREEIQIAIRKEVKVKVKAYLTQRKDAIYKKADAEVKELTRKL